MSCEPAAEEAQAAAAGKNARGGDQSSQPVTESVPPLPSDALLTTGSNDMDRHNSQSSAPLLPDPCVHPVRQPSAVSLLLEDCAPSLETAASESAQASIVQAAGTADSGSFDHTAAAELHIKDKHSMSAFTGAHTDAAMDSTFPRADLSSAQTIADSTAAGLCHLQATCALVTAVHPSVHKADTEVPNGIVQLVASCVELPPCALAPRPPSEPADSGEWKASEASCIG